MGAIKHNNVHSVEMLTAGNGRDSYLSQHVPLDWPAPSMWCLPLTEQRQLRGRFNSSRGGFSDSALCKFSSELLPQVSLFCESEELVQLCFLNHLISTLRPTPRWGRPCICWQSAWACKQGAGLLCLLSVQSIKGLPLGGLGRVLPLR